MKCGSCGCTLCKNDCKCARYTEFFETLGNLNRLHILNALRDGSKNVSELIEITNLEQSCVSHCLRKLQQHGFVTVTANGKYREYTLNAKTIEPLLQLIDKHLTEARHAIPTVPLAAR